jgi:hypothetical protein
MNKNVQHSEVKLIYFFIMHKKVLFSICCSTPFTPFVLHWKSYKIKMKQENFVTDKTKIFAYFKCR